jgi:hypothetical protein
MVKRMRSVLGTGLAAISLAVAAATVTLALVVPGGIRGVPALLTDIPTFALQADASTDEQDSAANCAGTGAAVAAEAPGGSFEDGAILGTTTSDLTAFARRYNEIRIAHCVEPIPVGNFRYDPCMEERLAWMAGDPSEDPASAWGHEGSVRSDGVPSEGCDGNLAGGTANTGATVAEKWWESLPHRASLYRPANREPLDGVCIAFAMTHGGVPDEPKSFTRAAARWTDC